MFTPTAPEGLFLDEEKPQLHLNTYHKNLATFLDSLNCRRLHVKMCVNILAERNHTTIGVGVIRGIIPPQEYTGETGQYHEAVIAVQLVDGRIRWYGASRIVPASPITIADDVEKEIALSGQEERHPSRNCDD